MIVKGAAGTGKTTIMKAVTGLLEDYGTPFYLLAPTGRAANNIAVKTLYDACTIHSCIYHVNTDLSSGVTTFSAKTNHEQAEMVYIIDEASMISDRVMANIGNYESKSALLSDAIAYIKQGNVNNKIIFVGDDCQLPPIGYGIMDKSPALEANYLQRCFRLKGSVVELSTVMRQAEGSYILDIAYSVRGMMFTNNSFTRSIGRQMYKPDHVTDLYLERYSYNDPQAVAIVALANSYIDNCNQLVRAKLGLMNTIDVGDTLVVTHNFQNRNFVYIPNGEVVRVKTVGRINKVAELRFMEVAVEFYNVHLEEYQTVQTRIMLDALENPVSVTADKQQGLMASAMKNNPIFRSSRNVLDDEYLSAMQVNYSHAFSCHKAQGSEWNTILFNTWMKNLDYRFLYTGITRARQELFSNGAHTYAN